jgi:hypothetical protein
MKKNGLTHNSAQQDLEAARSPSSQSQASATKQNQPASPTQEVPSQTTTQQYAHSGRGGAGNWFSPQELTETGKFVTATDPSVQAKAQRATEGEIVSETRHRGRGGAGNFIWSQEEEDKRRADEEGKEIELKEMVARDVEAGLERPSRAVLHHPERGELETSGYM